MKVKELKQRLLDLLNILEDVDESLECIPHNIDEVLTIEVRNSEYWKAVHEQNVSLRKEYKTGVYDNITDNEFKAMMNKSNKLFLKDLTPTTTIKVFGFEPIAANLITEI